MFRQLPAMLFVSLCVFGSEAEAHPARVFNMTERKLQIMVFHFERPDRKWAVGVIPHQGQSEQADLTHGTRIIVAKDVATGEIVYTGSFKMGAKGTQVYLLKVDDGVGIDFAFDDNP